MRQELLRMDHVSLIRNGEALLDNLNFQMFAGEIMGLLTGRDKKHGQLIELVCRNLPISFGTVWYDGKLSTVIPTATEIPTKSVSLNKPAT